MLRKLGIVRKEEEEEAMVILMWLLHEINVCPFRLMSPMRCLPAIPELTVNGWLPQHSVVPCTCMNGNNLQESSHTPSVAVYRCTNILLLNIITSSSSSSSKSYSETNHMKRRHSHLSRMKQLPLLLHSFLRVIVDWWWAWMMDRCNGTTTMRNKCRTVVMN